MLISQPSAPHEYTPTSAPSRRGPRLQHGLRVHEGAAVELWAQYCASTLSPDDEEDEQERLEAPDRHGVHGDEPQLAARHRAALRVGASCPEIRHWSQPGERRCCSMGARTLALQRCSCWGHSSASQPPAAAAAAAAAALAARQSSRIAAAESPETLGSDPWNSSLNRTLLYSVQYSFWQAAEGSASSSSRIQVTTEFFLG
eukprot:COSAG01_NODE_6693_length_3540_cov_9.061029_3_plen_201_part_00